jgi:predicted metal-dependent HD superfamily phosphohydrolase
MSAAAMREWADARWRQLWHRLGASAPMDALAELLAAYAEDHRAYHDFEHIRACLRELDGVSASAAHPEEVEAALWFHDAIYDPRADDNEERSAKWAFRALRQQGVDESVAARVRDMIRATRHTSAPPRTSDEALLLDIDLAILGSSEERFRRYDEDIRSEYAWVPEKDYRAARARVLEGFLERDLIYRTDEMRERYEESARRNLARALAS